jgi:O-antigen ligase
MNSKPHWWEKFRSFARTNLVWLKLFLLFFIIFTFFLNLFYKISLDGAYVHGLLIDYLIPKFYVAELFLIPFLLIELRHLKKVKLRTSFCFLLLLLILRQLASGSALAAFTHLVHLLEVFLFFSVLKLDPLFQTKKAEKFILSAMLTTVLFQSLLAIYQFIFQKSLLAYQLLGETNLQVLTNISRAQFFFGERILPYGTLAHPNILAGTVVLLSILIFNKGQLSLKLKIFLATNALLIIFLTQSLSALLALGLFGFYLVINKLKAKKVLLALTYYFFLLFLPFLLSSGVGMQLDSNSVNRRSVLNQASIEMFRANPLFGVGINNFTIEVEKYASAAISGEVVRFVQPVHNLLFLILSEGGLLMLVVLFLLIRQAKIERFYQKTLILLAIASLDHYLLTQFSGVGLLALFYLLI